MTLPRFSGGRKLRMWVPFASGGGASSLSRSAGILASRTRRPESRACGRRWLVGSLAPPNDTGRKLRIALLPAMTQLRSMKCAQYQAEAIGICAYCGRALCAGCARSPDTPRLVCSAECAAALSRNDQVVQLLLQKSVQNAQASAFYCYLCGALSLGAAVGAHFILPLPFLIYFAAASGMVFILSGIWYGRSAKKQILKT